MEILVNIILYSVILNHAYFQLSDNLQVSYNESLKHDGLPLPQRLRNSTENMPTPDEKIVGGTVAGDCDGPWTVAIIRNDVKLKCGGSIYNKYTIITAAHCLERLDAANISIRYNSRNYDSGGTVISALKLIIHHGYDESTLNNDIGIIQLKSPMKLCSCNAKAVKLPPPKSEPYGNVTVHGWGRTTENGKLSYVLLVASVPMVDRKTCNKDYATFNDLTSIITKNMICAGTEGKDTCQGDSGGPLTQNGILYGIVSKGYGCAREGYPSVYVKVSNYLKWIKKNRAKY